MPKGDSRVSVVNFSSPQFALFLPIVLALYALLHTTTRSRTAENLMLLIASCFFYGCWDHRFLFLFLFSTALDYVCGLAMAHRRPPNSQIAVLAISMTAGGFFLCAPINWSVIWSSLLPNDAFSGGWAVRLPLETLFVPGGRWLDCIAALIGVAVEAAFFCYGYTLQGETQRKFFLALSLISQMALLGFFKYYDFFISGAERLAEAFGLGSYQWQLGIIVPVGISFYTFHTMSYTIDVYRGRLQPTESLIDFALFVAFFPQMVAGPIARAADLLPQFQRFRPFNWVVAQSAVYLIFWGLFKKLFIADNLLGLVNATYLSPSEVSGPQVLLATYAFAFQIYCDFSAYSDIARGSSRLMGIELMLNFNIPYAATNPRDFWRRWHISLSTWLRDYLYMGLGGSRGGAAFIYRNLMITMVLGGIWHGARANFFWWGVYQGLLLCAHRLAESRLNAVTPASGFARSLFRLASWVVFFHLVCYGWLLFRAESLDQVLQFSRALPVGWGDLQAHLGTLLRICFYCWPLWIIQIVQFRSGNLLAPLTWAWPVRALFYLLLFYLTVTFGAFHVVEFIYFQF